ncbi:histidine phosphotransferase [Rhodobacteraceae bacterium]|nr:histidine phosphotransferase [Paracoccaceae bacterium]
MTAALSSSSLSAESLSAEQDTADLVALVGSRLCHDLISPLGAIGNGVELMEMSGGTMSPELRLIAESVTAASARVKFFRIAFGQASPQQQVSASELRALCGDLSQSGRLSVEWQIDAAKPRSMVKLALLAVLCLETALPRGGHLTITEDQGVWRICATDVRTTCDHTLWDILDGASAGEIKPAQVQFLLLPSAARTFAQAVSWSIDETQAEICLSAV